MRSLTATGLEVNFGDLDETENKIHNMFNGTPTYYYTGSPHFPEACDVPGVSILITVSYGITKHL